VKCLYTANFGLPRRFRSRVRSSHATDRQTYRQRDGRSPFYNAPSPRWRGHNKLLWNAVSRYRTHVTNALVICRAARSARLACSLQLQPVTSSDRPHTCPPGTVPRPSVNYGQRRRPLSTYVWPICRRQNCTLLSKSLRYKSEYCIVVSYAETVDDRNFNCSTKIWKGRVKVVRRRRTTQTPTSSLTNYGTTTRSHLRTILTQSVCQPAVATDWTLTTQLRHLTVVSQCWLRPSADAVTTDRSLDFDTVPMCLGAVSTACRRSVAKSSTKTSPSTSRCYLLAPLLVTLLLIIN